MNPVTALSVVVQMKLRHLGVTACDSVECCRRTSLGYNELEAGFGTLWV